MYYLLIYLKFYQIIPPNNDYIYFGGEYCNFSFPGLPVYLSYSCQAINSLFLHFPSVLQSSQLPCHLLSLRASKTISQVPRQWHAYACHQVSIIKPQFESTRYTPTMVLIRKRLISKKKSLSKALDQPITQIGTKEWR